MSFTWVFASGMALSSVLAALGGVLILAAAWTRTPANEFELFASKTDDVAFLFDGDTLVDATPAARGIVALGPDIDNVLARVTALLSTRFPGFAERLLRLPEEGQFVLGATGEDAVLKGELLGGLTRITLIAGDRDEGSIAASAPLLMRTMEGEITSLRTILNRAPYLIWREDASARVIWPVTMRLEYCTLRVS